MTRSTTVTVDDQSIEYAQYGTQNQGPTFVLLHALLLSHRFQRPLAEELAGRGCHVIAIDLLGVDASGVHDPSRYTSERIAEQTLAVLIALDIERCVILGTSLGSSVAMEIARLDPGRVAGLVLEGPFLEGGTGATAFAWSLILAGFTTARPALTPLAATLRRVPRGTHVLSDMLLDHFSQDPRRTTAFLRGMTFGRMGPPRHEREQITTPAPVVGFPLDPFHPLADAEAVAGELPNARLMSGKTILDLRLAPAKLANEIRRFADDAWTGDGPRSP